MWVVPVLQMCVSHWSESVDSSDKTLPVFEQVGFIVHPGCVCVCAHIDALCASAEHYCPSACVCERCPADMWFTLVLFDVFIRGPFPPTSTQLFDLHQSDPDHSAFVYFQRHFSFCFSAPPLTLSLSL